MVHSIYKRGCIACGGEITDDRLVALGVCQSCYDGNEKDVQKVFNSLLVSKERIKELVFTKRELEKWTEIFRNCVGSTPWNTQVTWMKRVILGRSFSLVAPTGVGKTTFGITTALTMATKGKKSIIILPTTNLVSQVYEKFKEFSKKLGIEPRVIVYSSSHTEKQRNSFKADIRSGNYDIVVVTSSMVKGIVSLRKDIRFDFIFADDVDSLLKRSKNVEYVIMLSGLSEEDVGAVLEFVKLKFLLVTTKGSERFKDYLGRYNEMLEKVKRIKEKEKGILVVSSATARPRGARVKLFRELFNFEVGSRFEVSRNVGNYYILSSDREEKLVELVNLLGDGGIVFVTTEDGVEYAEKVSKVINSRTPFKSVVISSQKGSRGLEEFKKGEVNILVGVSTYYGSLVRGLDFPDRIVYAVFLGLPKFRIPVDPENLSLSPYQVLKLLLEVVDSIEDRKERKRVEAFIRRFRNNLNYEPLLRYGREILGKFLKDDRCIKALKEAPDIVFEKLGDRSFILVPDINTYVQGSGRTSRLYPGGMTRGISVIIESNKKLLEVGARKYKWIEEIEWEEFEKEKVLRDLEVARKDRERLKSTSKGEVEASIKKLNKTVLIVVESPTKARTISRLFGTPSERVIRGLNCYETTTGNMTLIVTSSRGHIFDLTVDEEDIYGMREVEGNLVPVYDSIKRCRECERTFVSAESRCIYCGRTDYLDRFEDLVALIELAKEVDEVLVASDPDTEGEKISYDIFAFLNAYVSFFGGRVRRLRFHEVTYHAIKNSLDNPDEVNTNLVEAQLLRRIEDRLIGFGLSSFLKEEFKEEFEGSRRLSAGRVQSPVLGWVVKRYEEYVNSKSHFTEVVLSTEGGDKISVQLEGIVDKGLVRGEMVNVKVVEEKEVRLPPPPPFTTDTALAQINRLLKISSNEIMSILQELFEEGLITYHRTDSTAVSTVGQGIAKEYLSMKGLTELSDPKSWASAGAHECIRPTRSIDAQTLSQLVNEGTLPISLFGKQYLIVYDLIFKRFIASQMRPSVVKNVTYSLRIGDKEVQISRNVGVIENGWNMFGYLQVEPPLPERVSVESIRILKKPKVSLLSEGDVIQLMKQKGIGRPSTYSKIVSTLVDRGYVFQKNNRLIPTKKGMKVFATLAERYSEFISEERTRYIEEVMEMVEQGNRNYFTVLAELVDECRVIISALSNTLA